MRKLVEVSRHLHGEQNLAEVDHDLEGRQEVDHSLDRVKNDPRGQPAEELESVPLTSGERRVSIDTKLGAEQKEKLISFLRANADLFAWSHKDMPGIDHEIMVHQLNVDRDFKLVKQKRRTFNPERNEIIVG